MGVMIEGVWHIEEPDAVPRPLACKRGYYSKSALRNPLGIMPEGPAIDLSVPHGRERLARAA